MLNIYLRIYKDKHPELYETLSVMPSSERTEFIRETLTKYLQSQTSNHAEAPVQSLRQMNERLQKIELSVQKLEVLLAELLKNSTVNSLPSKDTESKQETDTFIEKLQKGIDQILSMGKT